jgi:DNA-binding transcriptional LysR family regulator
MLDIRFNDLKNFIQAADCDSMVMAAKKIGISQPALSESIKRLEQDIKIKLFYRSRTGIQLTTTGKLFLEKATVLMEAYRQLDINSTQKDIFSGRTISVGCHTTVAQYCIPKALKYLAQLTPDYKIELKHDLSRNIQSQIQFGKTDIGVIVNPSRVPDIVIKKLAEDFVYVWSSKKIFNQNTLICHPHLFQSQSILNKWKYKPEKIITTESIELIANLTSEGLGYGIIPERAVEMQKINLTKYENLPYFKDELCLVYRPEFGKIESEKIVIDALSQSFS